MGNPLWFIFWALIFLFVSTIVAGISAFLYIPIYSLVKCFPALPVHFPGFSNITDFLLKGIQFPHFCGQACLECRAPC